MLGLALLSMEAKIRNQAAFKIPNSTDAGPRIKVPLLWVLQNFLEGVENRHTVREHAVSEKECVEKVDGKEAEVDKSVEDAINSGVTNLQEIKRKRKTGMSERNRDRGRRK